MYRLKLVRFNAVCRSEIVMFSRVVAVYNESLASTRLRCLALLMKFDAARHAELMSDASLLPRLAELVAVGDGTVQVPSLVRSF